MFVLYLSAIVAVVRELFSLIFAIAYILCVLRHSGISIFHLFIAVAFDILLLCGGGLFRGGVGASAMPTLDHYGSTKFELCVYVGGRFHMQCCRTCVL